MGKKTAVAAAKVAGQGHFVEGGEEVGGTRPAEHKHTIYYSPHNMKGEREAKCLFGSSERPALLAAAAADGAWREGEQRPYFFCAECLQIAKRVAAAAAAAATEEEEEEEETARMDDWWTTPLHRCSFYVTANMANKAIGHRARSLFIGKVPAFELRKKSKKARQRVRWHRINTARHQGRISQEKHQEHQLTYFLPPPPFCALLSS